MIKEIERFLTIANKVTAYHRHGNTIPKRALDNLCNAQLEIEKQLTQWTDDQWISVEDRLPEKEGRYKCKVHTGSMSPKIIEREVMFIHGKFPRMDWDYVTHWKPKD